MAVIYIMRHGESIVNITRRLTCKQYDGDLSALGREQAAKAAAWLTDKGVNLIRHSPFHRAQQSAEIIGEAPGVPVEMDVDLAEMDCGELEGKTDEDAWAVWAKVMVRWRAYDLDAAFPGGESFSQAAKRFARALAQVPEGRTALLVTHGGIATTVTPTLCVNAAALQRGDVLDNTGFIVLETYDEGRYACRAWNLVEHLENGNRA